MKNLVMVFCALLLSGCTDKSGSNNGFKNNYGTGVSSQLGRQNSIINGVPVTADDRLGKSLIGLLMKLDEGSNNKYWVPGCTGSVLNAKFILTAAHCVQGASPDELLVSFSLNTVTFEQQQNPATRVDVENVFVTRRVKSFLTHPDYSGLGNYDLAVILLEAEAPSDVQPVTFLPEEYLNRAEGKTNFNEEKHPVVLMGFGYMSENPYTGTDVLRQTTLTARFSNQFVITDQTQGSGGCHGDSGGPAFLKIAEIFYQVGVTHGPHGNSTTCHEEGEWYNPAFDKGFIKEAQSQLR